MEFFLCAAYSILDSDCNVKVMPPWGESEKKGNEISNMTSGHY